MPPALPRVVLLILWLVVLPSPVASFQSLAPLKGGRSENLLRGRPQPSSFYDWGGDPSPWAYLKPGTSVYVNDLGSLAVIVRNDGGGFYTLQYGAPPVLIRRHARDLSIPSMRPPSPQTRPSQPQVQQQKQPPRLESNPGDYTLFQDPKTGKVYAVARPRNPDVIGRRLQYSPPRDQLKDYGSNGRQSKSLFPGADFVRDSLESALEQQGPGGRAAFDLWRDLARAQLLEGDSRKAQDSYQRAQSIDPKRFMEDQMLSELGEAQHRQGRVSEAMQNYKKALNLNSENSRAALKYAISLHDQGNAPAAIPYYQRSIELDPSNLQAINNLGVALWELGQYESALACFKRALDIDGLHSPALQNLAALTLRQGRVKLAVECIRRTLLIDPNDPVARALLVQVMQAMSNRRSYQYPMLPGGVMDTTDQKGEVNELQENVDGWMTDGQEGSSGAEEAKKYLTWEDILRSAWKAREDMLRKKQQEEEERYKAEEQKRVKAREEAKERARQMEQRIQELFYGKPEERSPPTITERAPSPSREMSRASVEGARPEVTPIPGRGPGEQLGEGQRPMAAVSDYNYKPSPVSREQLTTADDTDASRGERDDGGLWQETATIDDDGRLDQGDEEMEGTWSQLSANTDIGVNRKQQQEVQVPREPMRMLRQQQQGGGLKKEEDQEGFMPSQKPMDEVTKEEQLLRERLQASLDAWDNLQRGAWVAEADQQRRNEAVLELQRALQRQQESKAKQEAELRRAKMKQEESEIEARKRRAELELEQRKAGEALRMAQIVEDKARRESEALQAQVEQDRAEAVKRAWEEHLHAAVEQDEKVKQLLEARRMEAVQKAVESERMLLEQERQRALIEEQVLREKEQSARAAREKAVLDELQEWERYRLRERERQTSDWEARELQMEEKRRRVQAGLGLDWEAPSSAGVKEEKEEDHKDDGEKEGKGQSQGLVPVSLPIMITRDMRRTLVEDLNYSLKDVNKLKPEEAMEIISKGIRNPMKDFRRPGTTASGDD